MIPEVGYHNKLLSMWTKRGRGATRRSGGCGRSGSGGWGTGVRDRPYFLGLSLHHPELGVRLVITNLYNISKIKNKRYILTK